MQEIKDLALILFQIAGFLFAMLGSAVMLIILAAMAYWGFLAIKDWRKAKRERKASAAGSSKTAERSDLL